MGDTKDGRDEKGLDEDKRQREFELEEELEEEEESEQRTAERDEEQAEKELADDE